jgi:Flp pilus assembly protein TadD
LEQAVARLRTGDLAGAEARLKAVLDAVPGDADARHLLGLVAFRRGRYEEACEAIGAAVALRPDVALYRGNLGRARAAAGRLEEAEEALGAAIACEPGHADFHYDLGLVRARRGRTEEAVACYRAAIAREPAHAEAHNNLGSALASLGRRDEAEASYRAAIGHDPGLAEAEANLGGLLCRIARWDEAEAALRRALELAPDFPEALNSLGTALMARRAFGEAEACLRRALALAPDYAEAYNNLGALLHAMGRFDEAEAALGKALGLRPEYAEAMTNLGNALVALGRLGEAETTLRAALRLRPGEAETEYSLGVALLAGGRLREGWAGFERRWERRGAEARALPAPAWNGEELGGRVLLVHAEQGLGDTIQFCRFLPTLGAGRVILEAPRPLVRLLSGLGGAARVIARGEALPRFDVYCPLMSLPRRLETALETIPTRVPYLAADGAAVARWAERLLSFAGLKIGLVWAGNPEFAADSRRSIDPRLLTPLLQVPGATFISLQHGERAPALPIPGWMGEVEDFSDTAALLSALDLVIAVDTAVVHLAGALGKPVWLLNRFDTCWRWLRGRPDSPWYPTLRQFRQARPGDWESVISAVRWALQKAVTHGDRMRFPDSGEAR